MNGMGGSAIAELVARLTADRLVRTIDYAPTAFGTDALPTTGATGTLIIDGDADFLLYNINGAAFSAAATYVQFPNITINLRNAGSGRYLSQSPMHWVTIVGSAQYPFYLPEPWFLPKTSNLTITLANLSGSQFTNVSMTFVGYKVFPMNGYDMSDFNGPDGGSSSLY